MGPSMTGNPEYDIDVAEKSAAMSPPLLEALTSASNEADRLHQAVSRLIDRLVPITQPEQAVPMPDGHGGVIVPQDQHRPMSEATSNLRVLSSYIGSATDRITHLMSMLDV